MPNPGSNRSPSDGLRVLIRLYWMFAGNALLFVLIVHLALHPRPFPAWIDAGCAAAVALLVGTRYADVRHLGGLTGDGQPATLAHWRRYAAGIAGIGLIAWGTARGLGMWLG